MAFYGDKGYIINDNLSNVHIVFEKGNVIKLYNFNGEENKSNEMILVEEEFYEFDTTIDSNDVIYLVYQTVDGSLWILTIADGDISKSLLIKGPASKMYNLNVFISDNSLNIVYCISSGENQNEYKIIHHYYINDNWESLEVGSIKVREIINEFVIVKNENNIMLAYYSNINNFEQIFIKRFDLINKKWGEPIQLTNSQSNKIYLDIFSETQNLIHLVYSEYDGGNLDIKYSKYKVSKDKVLLQFENFLSKSGNCSYPTFILDEEKLWIVWTEYNHLISLYSLNHGDSWSNPYYWQESEHCSFLRYRFMSNNPSVDQYYRFNYSFGKIYPEVCFIGFGDVENATEMPAKINKKNNRDNLNDNNKEENSIKKLKSNENSNGDINQIKISIREINERINNLSNNIKDDEEKKAISKEIEELEKWLVKLNKLEVRVRDIEDFLDRRSRGLFYRGR